MPKYAHAALALIPLLAGCALVSGGSGEFTVEGRTYRADRVECGRGDGEISISARSGPAAMDVRLTEADPPTITRVASGAAGSPPLLLMESERGQADLVRTGDTFRISGVLIHTEHSQNAAEGKDEEFSASFTCTSFRD